MVPSSTKPVACPKLIRPNETGREMRRGHKSAHCRKSLFYIRKGEVHVKRSRTLLFLLFERKESPIRRE